MNLIRGTEIAMRRSTGYGPSPRGGIRAGVGWTILSDSDTGADACPAVPGDSVEVFQVESWAQIATLSTHLPPISERNAAC
jgi:hypothetical protein